MFKGAFSAMVTPFRGGKVDEESLRGLTEFLIQQGIDGLIPCGTTGESATLSHEEHKRVIARVIEQANQRTLVIAGTGSNSTEEAIELTEYAQKAGADGALLVAPYYNKPTPEGQYLHFEKVAKSVQIPIILYNIPGRTGMNMSPSTIARLSKIPNIVAIKESSGSMDQVSQIRQLCGITLLSGDDSLTLPMLSLGAMGVISVVANVMPKEMVKMVKAFLEGDIQQAQKLHYQLLALAQVLFLETNPIPVKTALALMGRIQLEFRLPLCPMQAENEVKLKKVLKEYKLI